MPTCPCCGGLAGAPFYEVPRVPVHSVTVLRTPEAARAITTGRIALSLCEQCGFVFNAAFDGNKQDYFHDYVSTQAASSVFNSFHRRLAQDLIDRHGLHGRDVVEIGCGQGEFLQLLASLGGNRGTGFDPAYEPSTELPRDVRIIKDVYSARHAEAAGDFIACKMTLEHIDTVASFVGGVRDAAGDDPARVVFFQVPDAAHIFAQAGFWDVYYEHCSYFCPGTLRTLFEAAGFAVSTVRSDYDGQYLMVEGNPTSRPHAPMPPADLAAIVSLVRRFAREVPEHLAGWSRDLAAGKRAGRRTVLWGGGSKAVSFLTTLGITDEIEAAVDQNHEKHGSFLAVTAHPVIGPEALRDAPIDRVILMNPIYQEEVAAQLDRLNCRAELLAVTSPLARQAA